MKEKSYLSKEKTDCLKGLFALLIIVHHTRAQMVSLNDSVVGMILTAVGYLAVAMFFFFSGYGLEYQYNIKGEKYLDGFLRKRVLSFYLVCVLAIVIYSIFKIAMGDTVSFLLILQSFLFGKTIVTNGWYLQTIVLFYLLFYISYKFGKNLRYIWITFLIAFYIVFAVIVTNNPTYYQSVFAFLLGILWARKQNKIDTVLFTKKWIFIVLVFFTIFGVTLILGNTSILNGVLMLISKSISAVSFVVFVISLLSRMSINGTISSWLGNIYCELYIFQGIPIELLHSKVIFIHNDFVYLVSVIVLTVCISVAMHPIIIKITKFGQVKLPKEF